MPDNVVAKNEAPVWTPPAEGEYQAVCCDVIDLGMVDTGQYGPRHKVAILFQLETRNEETGERYVIAERHTLSMNEKANLRKFLGQWRGKPYTDAEAAHGIALDRLVGVNAIVPIVHNTVGEKVYANIFNIRPVPRGVALINVEGYERSARWAEKRQEAAGGKMSPPATNQPVARDPGRQSIKPRPPIFQGAAKAAGLGITDHDVPPAEYDGVPEDEDDDLPFKSAGSEKTCFKCSRTLPAESFYRHPMMGDGRLGKCKECTKADVRERRALVVEQYRAYDRQRYRDDVARRERLFSYREREPVKHRAHVKAKIAIAAGRLVRQPCEMCGDPKTDAHHDDYSKPLDVRWLCRTHHARHHGALRASA